MTYKAILSLVFFLSAITAFSQEKGIRFEKSLTWQQIKEKAKRENKYIFIDGFTTWCGPCKKMAAEVFPQEKVGQYFNANFINVAVQFDKTAKDNSYIKAWYKDAAALHQIYKINAYPTYLFLNPDGKLVYQYNSYAEADSFISKASTALKMDYEQLKKDYLNGNGKADASINKQLIKAAMQAWDNQFLQIILNDHLKNEANLLSPENLQYIAIATTKSTDPGFRVLLEHGNEADKIIGTGKSREILTTIIFDEEALPVVRQNGKKTSNGLMVIYSGDFFPSVDWDILKTKIQIKYPTFAENVLFQAKTSYYEGVQKWSRLADEISDYDDKGFLNNQQLNTFAWRLFNLCNDPETLKRAIKFSKKTLSDSGPNRFEYMNTYAHLLYKTGESAEALKVLEKAVAEAGSADYFKDTIRNMKEGNKLW